MRQVLTLTAPPLSGEEAALLLEDLTPALLHTLGAATSKEISSSYYGVRGEAILGGSKEELHRDGPREFGRDWGSAFSAQFCLLRGGELALAVLTRCSDNPFHTMEILNTCASNFIAICQSVKGSDVTLEKILELKKMEVYFALQRILYTSKGMLFALTHGGGAEINLTGPDTTKQLANRIRKSSSKAKEGQQSVASLSDIERPFPMDTIDETEVDIQRLRVKVGNFQKKGADDAIVPSSRSRNEIMGALGLLNVSSDGDGSPDRVVDDDRDDKHAAEPVEKKTVEVDDAKIGDVRNSDHDSDSDSDSHLDNDNENDEDWNGGTFDGFAFDNGDDGGDIASPTVKNAEIAPLQDWGGIDSPAAADSVHASSFASWPGSPTQEERPAKGTPAHPSEVSESETEDSPESETEDSSESETDEDPSDSESNLDRDEEEKQEMHDKLEKPADQLADKMSGDYEGGNGAQEMGNEAGRPEKREKSKVTVNAPEATAVTLSKTGSVALLTGSIYSILTEDVTVTLANNRILSSSIVGNICVQCRSPSADTSTRASGRSAALLMLKRSDGAQLKVLHNKRLMRPHSKSSRPREEEKLIQYRCLFPADGKARQVLQFEAPMARVTPTLQHMMMLFTCKRIKTGLLLQLRAIVNPQADAGGLRNAKFSIHLPLLSTSVRLRSKPKAQLDGPTKVLSWKIAHLAPRQKITLSAEVNLSPSDTDAAHATIAKWKTSKVRVAFETERTNVSGLLMAIEAASSAGNIQWRSKRRTKYQYRYVNLR
eukprot:g131.t1